jgi:hypothetical protein
VSAIYATTAPPNCAAPEVHRDFWHYLPGPSWRCIAFACLPSAYRAAITRAMAAPNPFPWPGTSAPAVCVDPDRHRGASWQWEHGIMVCHAWACARQRWERDNSTMPKRPVDVRRTRLAPSNSVVANATACAEPSHRAFWSLAADRHTWACSHEGHQDHPLPK